MNAHSKIKENLPKLSIYRIWRKSLRTQEHVQLIHGKRAIGVRAIEVLLYIFLFGYNTVVQLAQFLLWIPVGNSFIERLRFTLNLSPSL